MKFTSKNRCTWFDNSRFLCLLFRKTALLFQKWLFYGLSTIFSSVMLAVMADKEIIMRNLFILLMILFTPITFACYDGAGSGRCGWYGTSPYGQGIGYGGSNSNNYDSTPRNIVIQLQDRYGAVAISSNGNSRWGQSSNELSLKKARKEAISKCTKSGGVNCKILHEHRNGCLSLASGYSPKTLWTIRSGFSANRHETEKMALEQCKNDGLLDCEMMSLETCSLPTLP